MKKYSEGNCDKMVTVMIGTGIQYEESQIFRRESLIFV